MNRVDIYSIIMTYYMFSPKNFQETAPTRILYNLYQEIPVSYSAFQWDHFFGLYHFIYNIIYNQYLQQQISLYFKIVIVGNEKIARSSIVMNIIGLFWITPF